ncbi:MAG: envelope biogenesis factor ElyC [Deltaproteobacteria bacterium]|nr:envelope biogenesis factor ElyC [Deltaproteobacteria bacterium]
MFLFKKIVEPLFYPLPLCLGILILGLLLLWFSQRRRTGRFIALMGVVLLGLLSYSAISDVFLRPLEYKYPSLMSVTSLKPLSHDVSVSVKWIAVLGGGHISDPQVSITSQISEASLVRLVEAIRLYRQLSGSKLILSGGSGFAPVSDAKVMAKVACFLGVNQQDMVLEEESSDTKDQARFIKQTVGEGRFILVTSASHMPRAIALFEKQGMNPIPAPTGYLVRKPQGISLKSFCPSSSGLRKVEIAMHEYLGLIWARLKG